MIKYHVEVLWENGGIVPWIPKFGAGLLGVDECQFHAPTIPPPALRRQESGSDTHCRNTQLVWMLWG